MVLSKDIVGEKQIQDDNGVLAFNEENEKAWKQHYERLLNVEFPLARRGSVNC